MGQRELKRWHLMEMVKVGKINLREAGEKIVDQGQVFYLGAILWSDDITYCGFVPA